MVMGRPAFTAKPALLAEPALLEKPLLPINPAFPAKPVLLVKPAAQPLHALLVKPVLPVKPVLLVKPVLPIRPVALPSPKLNSAALDIAMLAPAKLFILPFSVGQEFTIHGYLHPVALGILHLVYVHAEINCRHDSIAKLLLNHIL